MTTANRFHHFECKTIDVNPDEENDIFEFAHRVVFEALGIFGKIEKLQRFMEDHSEVKTAFDFNLAKGDENLKERNLLHVVNSLQRNKIPEHLEGLMDNHVELMKSITKNPKHKKFLDEFMRKQMEIVITNSFGLTGSDGEIIGSGIFPLSSLFNHSCAPNVMRIMLDNKLAFVTSRPIEKNQQLFVCYRSNFFGPSREERQQEIFDSYRFKCTCEACNKNFPALKNLQKTEENFKFSTESPREEFKFNCDYIDENSKKFPCFEICTLMTRNQAILESIANVAQPKDYVSHVY
jgi:SET domain